jgi:hypothetical protein
MRSLRGVHRLGESTHRCTDGCMITGQTSSSRNTDSSCLRVSSSVDVAEECQRMAVGSCPADSVVIGEFGQYSGATNHPIRKGSGDTHGMPLSL